ncbi:hypothetical protein H0H87_002740 [Tephrocybe sp. NHM501043]|nr:hypothetical protein H0H87_002740 [Tephrocybe sp. NHM501043]
MMPDSTSFEIPDIPGVPHFTNLMKLSKDSELAAAIITVEPEIFAVAKVPIDNSSVFIMYDSHNKPLHAPQGAIFVAFTTLEETVEFICSQHQITGFPKNVTASIVKPKYHPLGNTESYRDCSIRLLTVSATERSYKLELDEMKREEKKNLEILSSLRRRVEEQEIELADLRSRPSEPRYLNPFEPQQQAAWYVVL